jgi:hypothetical protein
VTIEGAFHGATEITAGEETSAMTAIDVQQPRASASTAGRIRSAARLVWLHLLCRRVPAALAALVGCGVFLWASLAYHWWLGTGPQAAEMPMIMEGGAAAIIAVATYTPLGETERATGRWLPVLRLVTALALCGAAIGILAVAAAVAYDPKHGVVLAGGVLAVTRNVLGMAGIGLLCSLVTGGLLAWIGPLAFMAVSQFALIANHTWPWTWPARPAADRGGWIAAMTVLAAALVAYTIRGPRINPSDNV